MQWRILRAAFGDAPEPPRARRRPQAGHLRLPRRRRLRLPRGDQGGRRTAAAFRVSWRADQPLLDALDALFAGAQLGDPAIRHRRVRARPGAEQRRARRPDVGAAAHRAHRPTATAAGSSCTKTRLGAKKSSVRAVHRRRPRRRGGRASSQAGYHHRRPRRSGPGRPRRAHPHPPRRRAAARRASHAVGVPAVVHGGPSVLATDAARDWLDLLRALEQPSSVTPGARRRRGPVRRLGRPRGSPSPTDADWEDVDGALHEWAAALRIRGVAGLLAASRPRTGLTARLLGTVGGERRLSDLRHVAELLHARQTAHPASIAALAAWLAEQIADGRPRRRRRRPPAPRVRRRRRRRPHHPRRQGPRVPDRAAALAVGRAAGSTTTDIPVFHDDDGSARDRRGRQPGPRVTGRSRSQGAAAQERDDEELRLLYVALTRARHQVVVWWATALRRRALGVRPHPARARPATGDGARRLAASSPTRTTSWPARWRARGIAVGRRHRGDRHAATSPPPADRPPSSPCAPSTAPSTATGSARPTAASPSGPRRRRSHGRRPRRARSTSPPRPSRSRSTRPPRSTSPTSAADRRPDRRRPSPSRCRSAPFPAAPGSAPSCTTILEHTDFAAPDLAAELAAAADRRRRPAHRRGPRRRPRRRAGASPSRRRSGPAGATAASATSPVPTASTSWPSTCRSPAATDPTARS